jgi:hypothetical protein
MANLVNTGIQYFYPEVNSTLAVTSATGRVDLTQTGDCIMLANDGYVTAYFALGDVTVTVVAGGVITAGSTGGMAILAGERLQIRMIPGQTYLAGITDSGTTTLRVSRGSGQ